MFAVESLNILPARKIQLGFTKDSNAMDNAGMLDPNRPRMLWEQPLPSGSRKTKLYARASGLG